MSSYSETDAYDNLLLHTDGSKRGEWTPNSWRQFPIKQQPEYPDEKALETTLQQVRSLPPLVHPKEVESLKAQLAAVCRGERFILQGGDCAERFLDCNQQAIEGKFKILLQMSLIIIWQSRIPVVRIGRLAGQFAKPRSSPNETINGVSYPSFKGDNVNSFDLSHREPDPNRLLLAYFHSSAALNYLRAMIAGGVANLHDAPTWKLDSIYDDDIRRNYEECIDRILEGLSFLSSINADQGESLKSVDLFTSHEGLLLNYEEALTKSTNSGFMNLGAHFLWIGDRTRQIDGAHIEYFRGIVNPVGLKVGPSITVDELVELVKVLNPKAEPGKLTLITRYGCDKVSKFLPEHIRAVKKTGIPVIWVCDPCHGNTEVTKQGIKTRDFEKITSELMQSFEIHTREKSRLGGVHLELTGEDVTECTGGSPQLQDHHLSEAYETFCDPRLNYTQSLDVAFAIAKQLTGGRTPGFQRRFSSVKSSPSVSLTSSEK